MPIPENLVNRLISIRTMMSTNAANVVQQSDDLQEELARLLLDNEAATLSLTDELQSFKDRHEILTAEVRTLTAKRLEYEKEITRLRAANESLSKELASRPAAPTPAPTPVPPTKPVPTPPTSPVSPLPAPLTAVTVTRIPTTGVVAFGCVFPVGAAKAISVWGGTVEMPSQTEVLASHTDGSIRHALIAVAGVNEAFKQGEPAILSLRNRPASPIREGIAGGGLTIPVVSLHIDNRYTYEPNDANRGGSKAMTGSLLVRHRHAVNVPRQSINAPSTVVFDIVYAVGRAVWCCVIAENTHPQAKTLSYKPTLYFNEQTVTFPSLITHNPFTRWRHIFTEHGGLGEVRFDPAFLVQSPALPTYDVARFKTPEAALGELQDDVLATLYNPQQPAKFMGSANVFPGMPAGGMTRGDIGPLPTWDALTVLTQDPRALAATNLASEASGRFPVHYRDPVTGLPYQVKDHPTASIHPNHRSAAKGDELPLSNPPGSLTPDSDHHPSLGYLAYLLQPWDTYSLEEVHFWVSYQTLSRPIGDGWRNGAQGLLKTGALRGYAWMMRTLATAAYLTPDNHPLRPELERLLANNLQDSANESRKPENSLGWWGHGRKSGPGVEWMAADVTDLTVPWQHDFGIVVWDWIYRMGYPQAADFRDMLIRGMVGRFLEMGNRFDGTSQHLAVIGTGGRYASWKEIHQKSFQGRPEVKKDFWQVQRPFDYAAIARAAMHRAVKARVKGQPTLDTVLRELDAACEAHAASHNADPRWRIV